jgi:hypothetical protein
MKSKRLTKGDKLENPNGSGKPLQPPEAERFLLALRAASRSGKGTVRDSLSYRGACE